MPLKNVARRRNYSKFQLSGMLAACKFILKNGDTLTNKEAIKVASLSQELKRLLRNWEKTVEDGE